MRYERAVANTVPENRTYVLTESGASFAAALSGLWEEKDRIMERRLELLAPAGSFESLKAAVRAGADAIYMGGSRFGARAYADNPEGDALLRAIDYAHLYGVKLYLTVNTLLKERELESELYDYLLPCYEHGLDAVIVQDLGVLRAVREWFPDLPVHASTQMTLCGSGGVKLLEEAGASRVVLARELSLTEIAKIREETSVEIECFVHGALCYCYSGQCLFSSILGGRSGNRGRCAQPCRLAYEAWAGGARVSEREEVALLSPKDICTIDLIPKIARAGVYSLKIEGRMKRPEYTAGVVRIYRKYIDRYLQYGEEEVRVSREDQRELLLLFNRDGFSRGYYEKHNGRDLMALKAKKPSEQEKRAYEALIAGLRRDYVETEPKIPVTGMLDAKAGEPMRLELAAGTATGPVCVSVSGACPQVPENQPMEAEQLKRPLQKTGNTPYTWAGLTVRMDGPLFVPVQALNRLRRDGLEQLTRAVTQASWRKRPGVPIRREREPEASGKICPVLHISVESEAQLENVLSLADDLKRYAVPLTAVYVDAEGMEERLLEQIRRIHGCGLKAWVMLPSIFRQRTVRRYEEHIDWWRALPADGYVIRNLEEHMFLRENDFPGDRILDHKVYTWNQRSCAFWREQGVRFLTGPLELNSRELQEVSSEDHIQIIYGRYPMMVTAGCLHRTLNRCRQKTELWTLKDRYQKEFPVRNCCRDCYNVIYNSQPLYLLDQMEALKRIGAGAYRIMFTTEGKEEVREVLESLMEQRKPAYAFTRGHMKRGVE